MLLKQEHNISRWHYAMGKGALSEFERCENGPKIEVALVQRPGEHGDYMFFWGMKFAEQVAAVTCRPGVAVDLVAVRKRVENAGNQWASFKQGVHGHDVVHRQGADWSHYRFSVGVDRLKWDAGGGYEEHRFWEDGEWL